MIPKKIQILGNPRTGSSYLSSVLELYIGYETLSGPLNTDKLPKNTDEHEAFFEKVVGHIYDADTITVKSHITHLSTQFIQPYPHLVEKFNGIPFYTIGLIRKNLLETAMSLTIGKMTNKFSHPYPHEAEGITLDVDQFKHYCEQVYRVHFIGFLDAIEHTTIDELIYYEDFIGTAREDFAQLQLCETPLDQLPLLHSTHKKAPKKQTVVHNYDTIVEIALDYANSQPIDSRFTMEDFVITDIHCL
jgi:hypothetical protein